LLACAPDMNAPLLIRGATLPTAARIDLLAMDGRIAALGPALAAPPGPR